MKMAGRLGAVASLALGTLAQKPEPLASCRVLPQAIGGGYPGMGTVGVGKCEGECRRLTIVDTVTNNPSSTEKVCRVKAIATEELVYTKIESCACREGRLNDLLRSNGDSIDPLLASIDERSSATNANNGARANNDGSRSWVSPREERSRFPDPIEPPKDNCRVKPRLKTVGQDAFGNDVVVDVGKCRGGCRSGEPNPPLSLDINITLTSDDRITDLWIDGVQRAADLNNPWLWSTKDTITQSSTWVPGSEHVIAVRARDTNGWVHGFIASVQYGGGLQHVTGNGDWLALPFEAEPQPDSSGNLWWELGYDTSSHPRWAAPSVCNAAWSNTWGSQPAGFAADGAKWVWYNSASCQVVYPTDPVYGGYYPITRFLLRFKVPDLPPQRSCSVETISQQKVEIATIKSCDCQCLKEVNCVLPLVWSDATCNCECGIRASDCPAGTIFNQDKCICENCGVCDAPTEDECQDQQCLFTFPPHSKYNGEPGKCVWRDFNGDGKKQCGCPQNTCQQATDEEMCTKENCIGESVAGTDQPCAYSKTFGQCDCPGRWAELPSLPIK